MSASPLSSSFTGPENRSTSLTFSLPYISSSSGA
ncbi:Uncharacterised protein [Bordetella pertussis]|nr:Uncharacterised protein [Bordetella pertussis]